MKIPIKKCKVFIIAAIICLPVLVKAQPPGDDDTTDVPLDGGLSLLVASGIGIGVVKAYKNRKQVKSIQSIH